MIQPESRGVIKSGQAAVALVWIGRDHFHVIPRRPHQETEVGRRGSRPYQRPDLLRSFNHTRKAACVESSFEFMLWDGCT